jgi:hypothetical protein
MVVAVPGVPLGFEVGGLIGLEVGVGLQQPGRDGALAEPLGAELLGGQASPIAWRAYSTGLKPSTRPGMVYARTCQTSSAW